LDFPEPLLPCTVIENTLDILLNKNIDDNNFEYDSGGVPGVLEINLLHMLLERPESPQRFNKFYNSISWPSLNDRLENTKDMVHDQMLLFNMMLNLEEVGSTAKKLRDLKAQYGSLDKVSVRKSEGLQKASGNLDELREWWWKVNYEKPRNVEILRFALYQLEKLPVEQMMAVVTRFGDSRSPDKYYFAEAPYTLKYPKDIKKAMFLHCKEVKLII